MVLVWITRSEPGASKLAEALQAKGFASLLAPVIEIETLRPWRAQVSGAAVAAADVISAPPEVVVALSAHAARAFLEQDLANAAGTASYLAVGDQTAGVLRERGLTVQVPDLATSEGLLALPALRDAESGTRVWVLAGVGGRDTVVGYLQDERHCRVVKFELYRRRRRPPEKIDADAVGAVVVSSVDGMEAAAAVWRLSRGALDVPVVVPSRRVAAAAAALDFSAVHVAAGASGEATLAMLERLRGAGSL